MDDKPPLPEPELLYHRPSLFGPGTVKVTGYSDAQLRAYGAACAAAERERCISAIRAVGPSAGSSLGLITEGFVEAIRKGE